VIKNKKTDDDSISMINTAVNIEFEKKSKIIQYKKLNVTVKKS
jgi:hypothetical protein